MSCLYRKFIALVCFITLAQRGGLTEAKVAKSNHIPISSRIVGGQEAQDNLAPYQCSIQTSVQGYSKFVCGCAIIDADWVLTAAHCIVYDGFNLTSSSIEVAVGSNKWWSGEYYKVNNIIVHEKYGRDDSINDIALVRVQKSIKFNDKVQPIKYTPNEVAPGTTLRITGWGSLREEDGPNPDKLQVLNVTSISNEECQQKSKEYVDVTILCTISPPFEGICTGDSGGPLVNMAGELVGLTSWGIPCAHGLPDGYVKISLLYPWIEEKTKANTVKGVLDMFFKEFLHVNLFSH